MQQQGEQILVAAISDLFHVLRNPLTGVQLTKLTILAWTPTSSQKYTLLPRGNLAFL